MGDQLEDIMGAVVTWGALFVVVSFVAAAFQGMIETEWIIKVIIAAVASTLINTLSGSRRI